MKYDFVLFDLDGTLTDPFLGITNSVIYALEKYGISAEAEELKAFIGPPLVDSFREFYGFDEQKAKEAVEVYREYFSVKGIFENQVYPGIPELLKELFEGGEKLLLATSKPEEFARRILDHFDLSRYFYRIGGSRMDGSLVKKEDVIDSVLKTPGLSGKGAMVGDRKFDILGGKQFGLDTVGVLFGYGSLEELTAAGADRIVSSVEELRTALL